MSTRPITQDIVLSNDTPWADLPSLMLPAYVQAWIMIGIVMAFVITIGGGGVTLFNSSARGCAHIAASMLPWAGSSIWTVAALPGAHGGDHPYQRRLSGTTIGIPARWWPMVVAGIPFFARLCCA